MEAKRLASRRAVVAVFSALLVAVMTFGMFPRAGYAETTTQEMYRLYNQWTGEHFYTAAAGERDHLKGVGWTYEGIGWVAPEKSGTPVYRLYNEFAPGGDHHYTMSAYERDELVKAGWKDEGIGWYSDDAETVALYRQYNKYAATGTHNYTTSATERDHLVEVGWKDEGVAWYAVEEGVPVDTGAGNAGSGNAGSGSTNSGGQESGELQTVYVTSSGKGKKFHRASCSSTKDSRMVSISRSDALSRGFEACKLCRP